MSAQSGKVAKLPKGVPQKSYKRGTDHHLFKDISGKKFGRLTVVKMFSKRDRHGNSFCLCKCDCGHDKQAVSHHLVKGNIKYCSKSLCRLKPRVRVGRRGKRPIKIKPVHDLEKQNNFLAQFLGTGR